MICQAFLTQYSIWVSIGKQIFILSNHIFVFQSFYFPDIFYYLILNQLFDFQTEQEHFQKLFDYISLPPKYNLVNSPETTLSPLVPQYLPASHAVHWETSCSLVEGLYVPAGQGWWVLDSVPLGQQQPTGHGYGE